MILRKGVAREQLTENLLRLSRRLRSMQRAVLDHFAHDTQPAYAPCVLLAS
jgi:phage gpG-like protein